MNLFLFGPHWPQDLGLICTLLLSLCGGGGGGSSLTRWWSGKLSFPHTSCGGVWEMGIPVFHGSLLPGVVLYPLIQHITHAHRVLMQGCGPRRSQWVEPFMCLCWLYCMVTCPSFLNTLYYQSAVNIWGGSNVFGTAVHPDHNSDCTNYSQTCYCSKSC